MEKQAIVNLLKSSGLVHPKLEQIAANLAELEEADLHRLIPLLSRYDPLLVSGMVKTQAEIGRLFAQQKLSLQKMADLVDASRRYAYLETAPLEQQDLNRTLTDALLMLESKLKEQGVQVQTELDELPPLTCYPGQLGQVWVNLLSNAAEALVGHGTIRVSSAVEGEEIVVRITDDGPGIPAELAQKVFDPFYTTKSRGQGTGLGLTICRRIVEEGHGGRLLLHSHPGETTFEVRIPTKNTGKKNSVKQDHD